MPLSLLISGSGIAGPALAYWLPRDRFNCTIIERAPVPRSTGQQIDLRGAALEIVKRMGLDDTIRAKTVHEEGLAFVDSAGKKKAGFGAEGGSQSFTAEIEILRGDLAQVFHDAVKDKVEYIWGDYIKGLSEVEDGVIVEFDKATQRKFDLVIGADGLTSKTRRLVFSESRFLSLKYHMAFFTIPVADHDGRWATWYNAPGARMLMIRPDLEHNRTGAYLAIRGSDVPKGYEKLSIAEQKKMWEVLFEGAGGESERAVQGMQNADDFYMTEIAQIRMPTWSKGRVVLLGDAAYCPSPFSGLGTSCAIVGAYVLAGELRKTGGDYKVAFARYEDVMRPITNSAQSVGPYMAPFATPQTSWGIFILHTILAFISWLGSWVPNYFEGGWYSFADLPKYDM